jgi:small subunit ribosomal protein S3
VGQKCRPTGLRLGIIENWRSRWYADKKSFGGCLVEDQKIRKFIKDNYAFAAVAMVEIERTAGGTTVILNTARPGLIIGRKGQEVDRLKSRLEDFVRGPVNVKIQEIDKPELNAQLVAESIAEQLEKRASFRRTSKRATEQVMENGAQGVKVRLAGRLGGAEMARRDVQGAGKVPLQTLRAKIDYGFAEAHTTYGQIGVKVWIYTGDVLEDAEDQKKEVTHAVDAEASQVPQEPPRPDQGAGDAREHRGVR